MKGNSNGSLRESSWMPDFMKNSPRARELVYIMNCASERLEDWFALTPKANEMNNGWSRGIIPIIHQDRLDENRKRETATFLNNTYICANQGYGSSYITRKVIYFWKSDGGIMLGIKSQKAKNLNSKIFSIKFNALEVFQFHWHKLGNWRGVDQQLKKVR